MHHGFPPIFIIGSVASSGVRRVKSTRNELFDLRDDCLGDFQSPTEIAGIERRIGVGRGHLLVAEHDLAFDPVALAEPLTRQVSHRPADQLHARLAIAGERQSRLHRLERLPHRIDRHVEPGRCVEQRGNDLPDRHDRPVLLRLGAIPRI
ncbi:hypothetical protein [Sphingomonas bacterium]|uniref:hypothetical protein n=1 Tax=Sphingomonas bacterium TaxID=1895847 RepID=UPI0015757172|nr:hypothetical protein [Sphingomonas bacterium]